MKQKFMVVALALCALIVSAFASQSAHVQDQEKALDSVLIAPTDWKSLRDIEMLADDCDPEKKSTACMSSLPKPKTTEEAQDEANGTRTLSECYNDGNVSKVLVAYKPCYTAIARTAKASGSVQVTVVVDEAGNVTWARAWKGHPLLQSAAVRAACRWRFEPAICGREKRSVNRMISFNFTHAM